MSHPTLNIHKAFFAIGKAFRVTGVYGLFLSLTHSLPTSLSLSEKLLEPIALAYLLCIMGCSVPEDWLGWEERPEERRKWTRGRETKQSSAQGRLLLWAQGSPGLYCNDFAICVCVRVHEVVATSSSQAEIEGYFE